MVQTWLWRAAIVLPAALAAIRPIYHLVSHALGAPHVH